MLIGLQFSAIFLSPSLKIGVTSAFFHSLGTTASSSDLLKILVRGTTSSSLHLAITFGWILSSPRDLLGFRLFRMLDSFLTYNDIV